MYRIGYVLPEDKEKRYIDTILDEQLYEFYEVNEDKFSGFSSLDGLVLEEHNSTNINWVCELLIDIRKSSELPVWILAPNADISKSIRLLYFQLGADGVFDQTHNLDEFTLVAKRIMERKEKASIKKEHVRKVEEGAEFQLLPKSLSVRLNDGKEVDLTRLEFRLIQYLYKHVKETVTYEEIHQILWKDRDEICKYRVSNIIFHLRRKIEENEKEPKYIKNVRNRGYKFVV